MNRQFTIQLLKEEINKLPNSLKVEKKTTQVEDVLKLISLHTIQYCKSMTIGCFQCCHTP